jgi:indole-3-glycerol phosphate synthase
MEAEIIEETKVIEMNSETKTTEELREDLRQILGTKLETFLTTFNSELDKNGFILDVETVSSSKGRFNRMVIFDK